LPTLHFSDINEPVDWKLYRPYICFTDEQYCTSCYLFAFISPLVNFSVSSSVLTIGINALFPVIGFYDVTVSAILEGLLTERKNFFCECAYSMIYILQFVP
jgi:hypothetical protein